MVLLNNQEVKYSILFAGQKPDINFIREALMDGIKVIWFGKKEDNARLNKEFSAFVKENFLALFNDVGRIKLIIIDGININDHTDALEKLEVANPHFNLSQYTIEHNNDAELIIVQAGAGSGKTFVMNNRLLYLLHTRENFRLGDVVMITFTNEATDSMRKKLIELLNAKLTLTGNIKYLRWVEEVPQIAINTIHAFFKRIFLEVGPLIGYGSNLRMTSMIREKQNILRTILDEIYGENSSSVKSVLGLNISELENLAKQFWTKIENNGMSESDVSNMDWGSTSDDSAIKIQQSLMRIFEEVEERYQQVKFANNAIAMTDILHEFARVIDDERVTEYISTKYKYIFCDEFQDSDDIQIKTITMLNKIYGSNLFIVGDIKQSIYRFRGATDSAFKELKDDQRILGNSLIKQAEYTLSKNYRTSPDILNQIDNVFRYWSRKGFLQYRFTGKSSDVLTAQKEINGIFEIIQVKKVTASYIENVDRKNKVLSKVLDIRSFAPQKGIMLLTRTNRQLKELKHWLHDAGLPCLIKERGTFYNSPAVRDFCALVEALEYNHEPMYLYNLLSTAYCYVDVDYKEMASFNGDRVKLINYLNNIISQNIEFNDWLEGIKTKPIMAMISEIIKICQPAITYGAIQHQKYLLDEKYTTPDALEQAILDAKQYEADLQKLIQLTTNMFSGQFANLVDLSKFVRLKINTDTVEDSADIDSEELRDCIQGSTVHSAKGLEFDYVLLPFMNQPFGQDYMSEILIDKHERKVGWRYKPKKGHSEYDSESENVNYQTLSLTEQQEVIGDETRLLYVAMTRAIEGLYCFAEKHQGDDVNTWADLLPGGR